MEKSRRKEIDAMKRIIPLVLAVCACFALLISTPSAHAEGSGVSLSFAPADAVLNDDGSVIYLSDKPAKKVYSIDTETFEQKSISFDLMPESLYYNEGKLYVSLCTRAHSSYWQDEYQSGAFAIIDCITFTKTAQYAINVDPYDIVVSNDGNIYITSGSGQWTDIYGFKPDGTTLTAGSIRQASTVKYNPVINTLYTITSDVSPRNMTAFSLDDSGVIIDSYGWPYHGDYAMGTAFRISPDGAYIFNSSGNIFTCNADRSNNMRFHISLNGGWTALAFNDSGTEFYTALNNKQIYAYKYSSFEGIASYEAQGYPQYLFAKDNTLIAISTETFGGNTYFIETIDLSAPKATIETTVTSVPLSYENGYALLSAKSNVKTVFNDDVMYIADSADNAVYAIDTAAMTETKITFPDTPNSLYYDNGELFVGFGNNGVVAILDAITFSVKDKLILGTTFYDVAVGKDGYIYVIENFGSSAFSYARSFSRTTGQQISSKGVYPRNGKFVPHPVNNMLYWADTDVSPQDVNALIYENGVIQAAYDSPYHGSYDIGSRIRISPDGASIFTSAGSVFASSNVQSADMQYKNRFTSFTDLVFDLSNNRMFASQSRANLIVYNYETYGNEGFLKTAFPVKEMTMFNGDIIALSSENNIVYLEILDSDNILQVLPETINVTVSDTVFMGSGSSLNLSPTILYNDGTSKSIADTAAYISSAKDIADAASPGKLQAYSAGYAQITIESDGILKNIDVFVDFDITSINVEGYDINFSPTKINYTVILPDNTSDAPNVTFDAPEYVDVAVTQATELPGAATLVLTDGSGLFTKTYTIYFYTSAPPVQDNVKPFINNGVYYISDGWVHITIWIEDNPDYLGVVPNEFFLVVQLMSSEGEPISISASANTRYLEFSFREEYYAVGMVVDKFGQSGYIGVLLADPKST